MVDWNEIRKEFPVLEKYVYLNPAGGSPLSKSAAGAAKLYLDEMVEEGDIPFDRWMTRSEQVRQQVADLINAQAGEIGFTTSTSASMNLIAQTLRGKGGVLTMRDEFPSSTIPWINAGYPVRFIEALNHDYPIEWIEKHITPETGIVVSSVVQYCTGFRQDMEALGKLCRKHGLTFVANATQAIGVMPVDVVASEVDCMAFSGLKWTTSGYGAGIVYIRDAVLQTHPVAAAGWQSVESPYAMDNAAMNIRRQASALECGCPHFPSVFALGGALNLLNSIGYLKIHERILFLNRLLQKEVESIGLPVISPSDEKHRSGILIIKTKNARKVKDELAARKIFVAARGEGIRASVSFFNNEQDIERFIAEVAEMKELF